MSATHNPRQNHLLAALPASDFDRLQSGLKLVPLPLGEVLYESGSQLRHVYFPTNAIVSLLYLMADGASAEIAVVGNEGIIGVSLFMGGETTPSRAVVQSAGHAYQLTGNLLKEEFNQGGSAAVSLVAAESRPVVGQRPRHDAGIDRQHARCTPRRRH
jgi:CRP-like cAMP-binding protein